MGMNATEAKNALLEGKKIARPAWHQAFLEADEKGQLWLRCYNGRWRSPWAPLSVDLRATDWYVVNDLPLLGA